MARVLRDPDITLTSQLCDSGGKSLLKASVSWDISLEAQLCIPGLHGAGGDKCTETHGGKTPATGRSLFP